MAPEVTKSGYVAFVQVSFEELLARDEQAAHRLRDEFSEVINMLFNGETFRRRSGHSLQDMLGWLEDDLTEALNRVAPEDTCWDKGEDGRYTFVAIVVG